MLNTKLSGIMSTDLVTISPQDSMEKVDEIFRSHYIHHLPVIDEHGKVVGMLSKSDYLLYSDSLSLFKKEVKAEMNRRIFDDIPVAEVMSRQVATLNADDPVRLAAALFRENLFHAIPIVDARQKLVGIVTTFDMMNFAFREPAQLLKKGKQV